MGGWLPTFSIQHMAAPKISIALKKHLQDINIPWSLGEGKNSLNFYSCHDKEWFLPLSYVNDPYKKVDLEYM